MDPVGCQTEKSQARIDPGYCSPASLAFTQQRHAVALSLHANMSHYDLFEPQLLREIIQLVNHEFINPWPLGCHIESRKPGDMWLMYGPADDDSTQRGDASHSIQMKDTSFSTRGGEASLSTQRLTDDRKEETHCAQKLKRNCVLRGTLKQQPISSCRRHQLYFVATAASGTEAQKEKSFAEVLIQFSGDYSIYADLIVEHPNYELLLECYQPHGKRSFSPSGGMQSGPPSDGDIFVLSSAFRPSLHLQVSWTGFLTKGDILRLIGVDLRNTPPKENYTGVLPDFQAGVWRIAHHCQVFLTRFMYEVD